MSTFEKKPQASPDLCDSFVYSAATASAITPSNSYNIYHLTALSGALTINNPIEAPRDGQQMRIRLLDNGTQRALTFGDAYVAKAGVALPTTTTASKNLEMGFEWNANLSKYNLLAVGLEA